MTPKFNYISVLAVFSIPAFTVFFNREMDSSIALSFGYLAYLGYLWIPMDELFIKRVQDAASITIFILLLSLSIIYLVYYFIEPSTSNLELGFWIHFLLTHVVFNTLLVLFVSYDSVRSTHD